MAAVDKPAQHCAQARASAMQNVKGFLLSSLTALESMEHSPPHLPAPKQPRCSNPPATSSSSMPSSSSSSSWSHSPSSSSSLSLSSTRRDRRDVAPFTFPFAPAPFPPFPPAAAPLPPAPEAPPTPPTATPAVAAVARPLGFMAAGVVPLALPRLGAGGLPAGVMAAAAAADVSRSRLLAAAAEGSAPPGSRKRQQIEFMQKLTYSLAWLGSDVQKTIHSLKQMLSCPGPTVTGHQHHHCIRHNLSPAMTGGHTHKAVFMLTREGVPGSCE